MLGNDKIHHVLNFEPNLTVGREVITTWEKHPLDRKWTIYAKIERGDIDFMAALDTGT